jgi:hypothetical protein
MKTSIHALARNLSPELRERYTALGMRQCDVRDAYDERIAICTVNGGQTEEQAHRIAMAEVAYLLRSGCPDHARG